MNISLLKALAHRVCVVSVEQKQTAIRFTMYEKANVKVEQIPTLLQQFGGNLKFTIDTNPYFTYQRLGKNRDEKEEDVLEIVKNVLNCIKILLD